MQAEEEFARMRIFKQAVKDESVILKKVIGRDGQTYKDVFAVIIQTELSQLVYSSNDDNTILKVERNPGEDILYFKTNPDSNILLTFSRHRYEPLTVYLYNYGVQFETGKAWRLKVIRTERVQKLNIKIETQPKASKVLFDSVSIPIGKEYITTEGIYDIIISRVGYDTLIDKVLVTEDATSFKYDLKLPIKIHTIPKEAIVYIDENERVIDGQHGITPDKKHGIEIKWPGYETIHDTIEVSEEMSENERIFSFKMKQRDEDKQKFNSGYVGGLKVEYEPDLPKLGDQDLGNSFSLAVSLDIPLGIPLFSLTAYGGGGFGILQSETLQNSETDMFFFGNAGAGLQMNLTRNATGVYAKGVYTYRSVSFNPLGSEVSTTYSATGYAAGGGFQLTPSRNLSYRLELMYNWLEFDQVKIYGMPIDLEQTIDASGLTISFYLLYRYSLFE